jgi:hypothetical protein
MQHRSPDLLAEEGRHCLSRAATILDGFNQEQAWISQPLFLLYSCWLCIAWHEVCSVKWVYQHCGNGV